MKTTTLLSPAKLKKCTLWLASNGIDACRLCGFKKLDIRDVVIAPIVDVETQTPQPHGMPLVAVTCSRCLHVMMFDAVRIGLLGKGP